MILVDVSATPLAYRRGIDVRSSDIVNRAFELDGIYRRKDDREVNKKMAKKADRITRNVQGQQAAEQEVRERQQAVERQRQETARLQQEEARLRQEMEDLQRLLAQQRGQQGGSGR